MSPWLRLSGAINKAPRNLRRDKWKKQKAEKLSEVTDQSFPSQKTSLFQAKKK